MCEMEGRWWRGLGDSGTKGGDGEWVAGVVTKVAGGRATGMERGDWMGKAPFHCN